MANETDAEIIQHVRLMDTPTDADPRRRYTEAQLEMAIRLARRGAAMQWRPIDEAPKDGTPVRLWRPAPEDGKWQQEVTAIWDTNCDGWVWPDDPVESIFNPQDWLEKEDHYTSTAFTHWMPLPPPPAGEQR